MQCALDILDGKGRSSYSQQNVVAVIDPLNISYVGLTGFTFKEKTNFD